jgi:hypothetical protein
MRKITTAVLAASTILTACGRPSPPAAPAPSPPPPAGLAYSCQGGGSGVQVAYVGQGALVTYGGETWNMTPGKTPGSFTAQGRIWQVRPYADHEEGELSVAGPHPTVVTHCQRQGPVSPAAAGLPLDGGPSPCTAGDLSLKFLGDDPGAGQRNLSFSVKNRGLATCSVQGFPVVTLVGPDGLPTPHVKVKTSLTTGPSTGPAAKLTLAPGQQSVFYMHYTVIGSDDTPCPQVSRLSIELPGGKTGMVPLEAQPCGGQVQVSPLRPAPAA